MNHFKEDSIRVIKKYPNRRLYDTGISSYIVLSDIKDLILQNEPVSVIEAKSEKDITREVLLQILLNDEKNQRNFIFNCDVISVIIKLLYYRLWNVMSEVILQDIKLLESFRELSLDMLERELDSDGFKSDDEILSRFDKLLEDHSLKMKTILLDSYKNIRKNIVNSISDSHVLT